VPQLLSSNARARQVRRQTGTLRTPLFTVARRKDPHDNLTSVDALTLARIDRHDRREEGEAIALRPR